MTSDSFKESYNEIIDAPVEKITSRRDTRFRDLQTLIKKYGMDGYCAVHPDFLWWAVLDYFKDVDRLKKRHGYQYTQIEKVYAYELYWYLCNNVIQVTNHEKQMEDNQLKEYPDRLFVNEYILSYWVMKSVCTELKRNVASNVQIDDLIINFEDRFENHRSIVEFRKKLFYTFRRRTYTQESLLLTLEGLRTGVEFMYSNI